MSTIYMYLGFAHHFEFLKIGQLQDSSVNGICYSYETLNHDIIILL